MKLKLLRPFPEKYPISSPFGKVRTLTIKGKTSVTAPHKGIDFAVPVGTDVRAMRDSAIYMVGWEAAPSLYPEDYQARGLGLRIWTKFDYNGVKIFAWYGHLSSVDPGIIPYYKIKEGEIIGKSGNTGHSDGPHCHVQFRVVNTAEMLDSEFYL